MRTPQEARLRLVVNNSGRGIGLTHNDSVRQEARRQLYLCAQCDPCNQDAVAMRDTVALPLVDSLPIDGIAGRPLDGACQLCPSTEGSDQLCVSVHGENMIRRFVGFVNPLKSDDLPDLESDNPAMATKDSRDPYRVAVGQRLREVRLALDYDTARGFAEILEVDEDRLGKWETGVNLLPPPYALKLRRRFAVTTDWLYAGDPTGLPARLYQRLEDLEAI